MLPVPATCHEARPPVLPQPGKPAHLPRREIGHAERQALQHRHAVRAAHAVGRGAAGPAADALVGGGHARRPPPRRVAVRAEQVDEAAPEPVPQRPFLPAPAGSVTLPEDVCTRQPARTISSIRAESSRDSAFRSGWARIGRTPARRSRSTVGRRSTNTPCGISSSMYCPRFATLSSSPAFHASGVSGSAITSAHGSTVSGTPASRRSWPSRRADSRMRSGVTSGQRSFW